MPNSIFLTLNESEYLILKTLNQPCALFSCNRDKSWSTECAGKNVYLLPFLGASGDVDKVKRVLLELQGKCPKPRAVATFKYGDLAFNRLDEYLKAIGDDDAASFYLDSILMGDDLAHPITELEIPEELQQEMAKHELEFPEEVMIGVAGDFARLYSEYLESPPSFFYFSFLTCLGAILSGRATCESELAPQPRLFTLILGESADDRKSTSISKTVEFFRESLYQGCLHISWGVGSAEGLVGLFDESNGGNKRVLLCLDEFKQFVSKTLIESSVLLPCVNTLYESNTFHSRTKSSAIALDDAHLSLLAASTIATYERTWTSAFFDIGFTNRLLIIPGTASRKFAIPPMIPPKEKMKLRSNLGSILALVGEELRLSFTIEALRLYDGWYQNRQTSVHSKRLDTYAMRFMVLLAVNDGRDHIDDEIVRRSVRLVDWQLAIRRAFDPIDAENKVARLEAEISRVLLRKGPLTKRELQQYAHAARYGTWLFNAALSNLKKDQQIDFDMERKRVLLKERV